MIRAEIEALAERLAKRGYVICGEGDGTVKDADCAAAASALRAQAATIAELTRERDAAREALRPFAEITQSSMVWDDDDPDEALWFIHDGAILKVGDLRRAREALASEPRP